MNHWLAAILALVFLYLVRGILTPFLIAIILAYILVPGIDLLAARLKVRRPVVVGVLYLLLLAGLVLLIRTAGPLLQEELRLLREDSVTVVQSALTQLIGAEEVDLLGVSVHTHSLAVEIVNRGREILGSPQNALQYASAVLTRLGEAVLTLIVLAYLLLDWEKLSGLLFRFVPVEARPRAESITAQIHLILGRYIRGQLVLIAFIATLTWIALQFFFRLPFALVLAITTGFLEVLPLVGPVLAAAIAAFVALAKGGPQFAIFVIIFYTVLRLAEDWFIAPHILGHAVEIHPGIALFAVMAGGAIAGPLGLLLAVPTAAAIKVVFDVTQPPYKAPPSPELNS